MAFQLDSNIPMSFRPAPSAIDQMSSIMSLADLIDKRKANKLALDKAQREESALADMRSMLGSSAREQLRTFNTVPPVAPVTAPDMVSKYEAIKALTPDTAENRMQLDAIGATTTAGRPNYSPVGPQIPEAPTVSNIPSLEQFQARPEVAPIIAQRKQQEELQAQQMLQQKPEGRVPEAYKFLTPEQYKNFLTVSTRHPDLGMEYLTKIIDQKKTIAEANKLNITGGYGNTDLGLNLRLAQDPEYVASVQGDIDRLTSLGKLPPEIGEQLKAMAITKPVTARQQAYEFTSRISGAVEQEEAVRPGRVQTEKEKELITAPIKVSTAAATETAKTKAGAEADTAVAGNSVPGFKPIPGKNITEADAKAIKDAEPMTATLFKDISDLRARYKKQGVKILGDDAAWYQAKINGLQLAAKGPELYALGVLTGPDKGILDALLPDPSSIKVGMGKAFRGDLDVKFKAFEDYLKNKTDAFYKVHGFEKEQSAPSDQFIVGQSYTDAKGNRAEYLGNGKWKELK